jgi:hypothetical protein
VANTIDRATNPLYSREVTSPSLGAESKEISAKRGGERKGRCLILSSTPENPALGGVAKRRQVYAKEEYKRNEEEQKSWC